MVEPSSLLEMLPTDILVSHVLVYLPPSSCVFISRCSKTLHAKAREYCSTGACAILQSEFPSTIPYRTCAITYDDPWLLATDMNLLDELHASEYELQRYVVLTMEMCAFRLSPPHDMLAFLCELLKNNPFTFKVMELEVREKKRLKKGE